MVTTPTDWCGGSLRKANPKVQGWLGGRAGRSGRGAGGLIFGDQTLGLEADVAAPGLVVDVREHDLFEILAAVRAVVHGSLPGLVWTLRRQRK